MMAGHLMLDDRANMDPNITVTAAPVVLVVVMSK